MTDRPRPTDDELLSALKDSIDNSVEVTDDTIDMLMTGYDIVHTDVLEADLVFDSLAGAGVRSGAGPTRLLRFEHDDVAIDVELDDVALRCIGRASPSGGALHLEHMSGTRQIGLSDGGSFDEIVEPSGPFRLRYDIGGRSVSTTWLQFGPTED